MEKFGYNIYCAKKILKILFLLLILIQPIAYCEDEVIIEGNQIIIVGDPTSKGLVQSGKPEKRKDFTTQNSKIDQAIDKEKDEEKRRWSNFNITKGMKRETVEAIAGKVGILREPMYTERVLDYKMEARHFKFQKRIRLGPYRDVISVVDSIEPKR